MSLTDDQAYALTKRVSPELTEAERQFALTIARIETHYGDAWTGDAVGSNNWGAVQGTGPAGYFLHVDHHADGAVYTTKFRKYNSADEGWLDVVKYALRQNVRDVLNSTADAMKALDVMRNQNHYFELPLAQYQARFNANYPELIKGAKVTAALGVGNAPPPLAPEPPFATVADELTFYRGLRRSLQSLLSHN